MTNEKITISTTVHAPVEKVWTCWTEPQHIIKWSSASDDWHTPRAENDLRVGGAFSSRMEAKDGSMGFDFGGIYDVVDQYSKIAYTLGDGRTVHIAFTPGANGTEIVQTFEAEGQNSVEMQRYGWQSILDNFKQYTETV